MQMQPRSSYGSNSGVDDDDDDDALLQAAMRELGLGLAAPTATEAAESKRSRILLERRAQARARLRRDERRDEDERRAGMGYSNDDSDDDAYCVEDLLGELERSMGRRAARQVSAPAPRVSRGSSSSSRGSAHGAPLGGCGGAGSRAEAIAVGSRVAMADGRCGAVRFIGSVHYARGEWVGIELDEPVGKNDGIVKGHRYFDAGEYRGAMSRRTELHLL